jgi:hypothetical protein
VFFDLGSSRAQRNDVFRSDEAEHNGAARA